MKTFLTIIVVLTLTMVAFFTNNNNVAYSSYTQPPSFNSGAPGQSTCNSNGCHDSFSPNSGSGSVTITYGNDNTEYSPGQTYNISVTIEQSDAVRFGFQMVAFDDNNESVGQFIEGNNTGIQNVANINFINHKNPTGNPNVYNFQWTAPSEDVGNITFYSTGNAANGINGPNGDRIYTTSLTIQPGVVINCNLILEQTSVDATSASVSASNGFGVVTFEWIDENGNVVGNQASVEDLMPNTTYTVTATDEENCTTSLTITTLPQSVAINNVTQTNIQVFPNPATDFINLNVKNEVISEITLYDIYGKQLATWHKLVNNKIDLPQNLTSGSYILNMKTQYNAIVIKKIFVVK